VAKDYPQLPEYPRAVAQQEFLDATGITRWGQRESGNFHWTDITPADAFAALAVYDKVAESAVRMAPDLYPDVASFYQAVHHQMGDRGFYQDQIASTRGLSEPTALETAKGMKGLTARKTSKGTGYSTGVVPALRGEKVMVSLFPKSFGYEAADLHTALHEWGHVIAGFLPEELRTQMVRAYGGEEAVRFNAPRAGAAPIWTSQMHEQFADDFVKYLVDGHMPDNPALHTPFNIIKDTMRRIWNRLRSYAQEPLRADVKQVFDRIFNVDAQPTINEKVWAAGFNSMEEARHAAARITLGQGLTKDSNEMGQLRKLKPSERADLLSTYPAREKPLPTDTPTMLNDIYDRGHSSDVPPEPDPSNLHVPYEQQLAGRGFAVPQVAKTGSIDPTTVFQAATPGSLNGLRDKVRAMFEPMSSKLTPSVARRKGNPATGWTEIGVDSEGKRVARDIWDDQPQAHAVTDVRIGDFKQIPNVADMLRQLGDVVDVHDYLGRTNNAGYRGFHIDVRTPEGHIVQFRIHTPDSYRAARAAAPYAQQLSDHQGQLQRFRNDLAQGKELTVEQGELYAALSKNLPEETAWVRSVFEPVVHQLRESIDGEMMTPTEKYVEGLRLLTLERITNQLWERTYKKYDNGMVTLFRRQYLPLKMASGAKWVERDAEGALVRDFVGGTDEMMLHNQRQATMQRTPIYFPFQRIYDIKPSDFALPKGGNMVTRSAGKYLKPVKGYLLSNGQYVVDPTQVFARRASQALRMAEAWDMAKEITETYGRPLFDEDGKKVSDFSRASEMLWSPQNMLRFFNQQIHLTDFLDHSLSGLAETDEALKEALDVVMPYAEGHVKEMLSATTKGARLYAIPKVVGSQLNKMVQRDFLVGRGVRLFWTKPSNVWRSAVLSLSPRWIVNNVVGNTVFTALQAGPVGLANTIRAATPRFKKMVEDLHEAGTEVFTPNVNQGFFHETGEQYRIQSGDAGINSMIEDISQRMAASKPVRGLAAVGNWVQNFNSAIESAYRQGSFLTEAEKSYALRSGTSVLKAFMSSKNDLEEMFTKGLRPQDIKRAEAGMNYWMNDYSKMSPLVRNYVKPFLFPFWSFYRHVGKLLLTMPLEHPVSANIGKQLTDVSNELTQGYGALPDFLRGGVVWGPSDTPGSTKFLSTTGPNPFNAVFQTPMSLLHPAIKTAMEQITGRTAYSNFSKHFTSPDVISPFGSENQYKVDAQGNVSQLSRGATPGIFEELLSQFPQYQTAKDVVAGGQYYSTSSLLDILKSRLQGYPNAGAVITDPANPGVPQYPFSLPEKLLKQTGISTLDYTVPPYQQSLATESSAAILEYLRRLGIAPPAGQQAAAAATTPGITYMG
jgi:hypothetical protein